MSHAAHQAGMTLVELMIAMLIGTLLVGGAITLYEQSRRNFRTAESLAQLQDNARFAVDAIEPDLRLAGFWGLAGDLRWPGPPAGVTVSCAGASPAAATAWALALEFPVAALDDVYTLDCRGTLPRDGSDVLVVRHAGARQSADPGQPGLVQVQANPGGADVYADGVPPPRPPPVETRPVVVNAYYVSDRSSFDAGLPALRRLSLVDGGGTPVIEDQEIIPGVENLQVQLGIDQDGDGRVDLYVDADDPLAEPGREVAVRFWLLVRSETGEAGIGFRDDAAYELPDADAPPIRPGADPRYPAEFRRIAVSKTVYLRN